MNKEIQLNELLKAIENKKPLVINFGKGRLSNNDVKDYAKWDDEVEAYRSFTGIWSIELLLEIAKGNVENTKIELESDY